MKPETLYQLHSYLKHASKLAQQYPELSNVWDNIENTMSELDLIVLPEEASE